MDCTNTVHNPYRNEEIDGEREKIIRKCHIYDESGLAINFLRLCFMFVWFHSVHMCVELWNRL